jgi:hypothetical protein
MSVLVAFTNWETITEIDLCIWKMWPLQNYEKLVWGPMQSFGEFLISYHGYCRTRFILFIIFLLLIAQHWPSVFLKGSYLKIYEILKKCCIIFLDLNSGINFRWRVIMWAETSELIGPLPSTDSNLYYVIFPMSFVYYNETFCNRNRSITCWRLHNKKHQT